MILVADHSKFGKIATTVVAPITAVRKIVTDSGISAEIFDELKKLGVEVIVASWSSTIPSVADKEDGLNTIPLLEGQL